MPAARHTESTPAQVRTWRAYASCRRSDLGGGAYAIGVAHIGVSGADACYARQWPGSTAVYSTSFQLLSSSVPVDGTIPGTSVLGKPCPVPPCLPCRPGGLLRCDYHKQLVRMPHFHVCVQRPARLPATLPQ